MRKLIIATTALAFIVSPALAQDKQGGTTGPAAQSDTMSKGAMSKDKMSKKSSKKSAKSAKKTGDETKQ
jgi:pentapeptide MXKDX repeat protein